MGILIVLFGLAFLAVFAVPELLVLVCVIEYGKLYPEPVPAAQRAAVSNFPETRRAPASSRRRPAA